MQSFVNVCCSTLSKVLGVSLLTFGVYVMTKSIVFDQTLSVLPTISLCFGAILVLTHIIEEIGKLLMMKQLLVVSVVCYFFLISWCIAVIAFALVNDKDFEILMAHEIGVLWLLRDSSKIYRAIIGILQSSLDCCKIHSVVRLVLSVFIQT